MGPVHSLMTTLRTFFQKVFTFDARSVGLFRWLMGLCFVLDGFVKLWGAPEFLTDSGLLPREAVLKNQFNPFRFSLHMASGSLSWEVLLLAIGILSGLAVMVGYRWRMAAFISFLLMGSLHVRMAFSLSGGDAVMKFAALWMIFLPGPGAFAVDRSNQSGEKVAGIGIAGLALQLVLIYLTTVIWKYDPTYFRDFDAVYYALHIDFFAKPLAVVLREYYPLTQALTIFTISSELFGPLIALIPLSSTRLAGAMLLQVFHFGLFATMALGMFSWIMMVYWVLFYPSDVWASWPFTKIEVALTRLTHGLKTFLHLTDAPAETLSAVKIRERVATAFVAFLVFYLAYDVSPREFRLRAQIIRSAAEIFYFDQSWSMFAPSTKMVNGWFIVEGEYENGEKFDLQTQEPVTEEKPRRVDEIYASQEWRKYFLILWNYGGKRYYPTLAKYFCRKGQDDPRKLKSIEIIYMKELTPAPGNPSLSAERFSAGVFECPRAT